MGDGCGWDGVGLGDFVGDGVCLVPPPECVSDRVGDGREASPDSGREVAAPVRLVRTAAAETRLPARLVAVVAAKPPALI